MKRKIVAVWVCAMVLASAFVMAGDAGREAEAKALPGNEVMYTPRAPIRINSNADFDEAHGVVNWDTGDGSLAKPWIIEGWDINGTGAGSCIYLGNTTAYFIVRDCNLHHASGLAWSTYYRNSGLYFHNAKYGYVQGIHSKNNRNGIYLANSHENTLSGNILENNIYGAYITNSHWNSLTGSSASFNTDGIRLYDSNDNTISGNNMSSNTAGGITLEGSMRNYLTENHISLNGNTGLTATTFSSNNLIYHNNFISNGVQAGDNGINQWDDDYPSGGNYWSDYSGVDMFSGPNQDQPGSDGFGDTAYNISGGGASDRYPRMEPWVDDSPYEPHAPFRINSNADFDEAHGVVNWDTGDGSAGNPWIIEEWDIDGTGYGYNMYIGNTTEHFVVRDSFLHGASGVSTAPYHWDSGLILYNVANGAVVNNTMSQNRNSGAFIRMSNNISLISNKMEENTHFAGITISTSEDVFCLNNSLSSNPSGISITYSKNIQLENNNMTENGVWIFGFIMEEWNSHTIDISNTVNGNPVRYLKNQSGVTVQPNAGQVILANCSGMNVIDQNLSEATSGILMFGSNNNTLSGNVISQGSFEAIMLIESHGNRIDGNTLTSNGRDGVFAWSCQGLEVVNNEIHSNQYGGVTTFESGGLSIAENVMTGNEIGVDVDWGCDVSIQSNTVVGSSGDGISIMETTSAEVVNNTVWGNQNGISIQYTDGCIAESNIIESNGDYGLYLYWSNDGVITKNKISDNLGYGIYTQFSDMNRIHGNRFIDNTNQVYDHTGTNQWDDGYPSGGNMWSDYFGQDLMSGPGQDIPGSDGIGDTPYTGIQGSYGAQDSYPLMPPYFTRAPIRINSNADFDQARGVVNWDTGDGTPGNPWIIAGWGIDGTGAGSCIYVGNTTEHFVIEDCYLHNATGNTGTYFWNAGVALFNAVNGNVTGNRAENCRNGIRVGDSLRNSISENNVKGNTYGLSVMGSDETTVIDNTATGNSHGLSMNSACNNTVSGNNLSGNTLGVYLISSAFLTSTHNVFRDNTLCNNTEFGFYVVSSRDNLFEGNNASHNMCGMYLYKSYCRNNIIVGNTFQGNSYGLFLEETGIENKAYHNSFIGNTLQAYDDTVANHWDNGYPLGGNYWSDYNGTDLFSGPGQDQVGSDGIGDVPYADIGGSGGAVDNYPLMEPWVSPPLITFNISLSEGWNLVSVPLIQADTSVESVLSSISGSWSVAKWYDGQTKIWKTHRAGYAQTLANIDYTMGFWLHAIENCTLAVSGEIPASADIILHAGWNLVGYPSLTDRNALDALVGTDADIISVYQSVSPYIQDISDLSSVIMKPGEGYWVHVPADTVWVVDW